MKNNKLPEFGPPPIKEQETKKNKEKPEKKSNSTDSLKSEQEHSRSGQWSMSDSDSGSDGESDDYSLKSSYDAEVAYGHSPKAVQNARLNHFHSDNIKELDRKETAKFVAPSLQTL